LSGPEGDVQIWGIAEYTKFICQFVLLFGLAFELPVVVMALVKLDILSYKVMKGSRSWAAIGIFVVSAIIAPSPDPQTLLLIAVPLYSLYELCIWMSWWLDKRDRKLYPEYYKEQDEDHKAIEASDEWDNESYNPWGDDEEEEEKPAPRPAPAGTQPIGAPTESSTAGESTGAESSTPTPSSEPTPPPAEPSHPTESTSEPAAPESAPPTEPPAGEASKPEEPKPESPDSPPAPGTDPHHPHGP
jgi:sec-independent protein translocase protein TatC